VIGYLLRRLKITGARLLNFPSGVFLGHPNVLRRPVGARAEVVVPVRVVPTEPLAAAEVHADRVLERLSEVTVEVGVDDGVEGRVEVADPEEDLHHQLGALAALAQVHGHVPDEKGQPAGYEGAHDETQSLGRLVFSLHLVDVPLGGGGVVVLDVRVAVVVGGVHHHLGRGVGAVPRVLRDGRVDLGPADHLLLFAGFEVDADVGADHDDAWYPKRHRRRDESVRLVDHELAHLWMLRPLQQVLVGGVPAQEDGDKTDEPRGQPHAGQHDGHGAPGDLVGVLERFDDGVVAVHADAAQVHDGGRREQHVAAVPEVASRLIEEPSPRECVYRVEAHGQQSDQDVGACQGHDEVVGGDPQLVVSVDAEDDEGVTEDGRRHDRDEGHRREEGDDDALPPGLVVRRAVDDGNQQAVVPQQRRCRLHHSVHGLDIPVHADKRVWSPERVS